MNLAKTAANIAADEYPETEATCKTLWRRYKRDRDCLAGEILDALKAAFAYGVTTTPPQKPENSSDSGVAGA